MTPYYADDMATLYHGDCLDVLADLPDCSIDAVVTDPPYGLRFMGAAWDGADIVTATRTRQAQAAMPDDGKAGANGGYRSASTEAGRYDLSANAAFGLWCQAWASECLRVLKPGGHLISFGGTRTWHRLASAVEDAGFEIRDSIAWLYAQGFPKSLDVSKAIDKAAGALAHESVGFTVAGRTDKNLPNPVVKGYTPPVPATPDAERWQGWGTALKPAFDPIVVARKPLAGTVAGNVLQHGTGALNIAACRVTADGPRPAPATSQGGVGSSHGDSTTCTCPEPAGDRTAHSQSTKLPPSSDASRGGRSGRPASARGRESGHPQPQGSQDGYPSSPRSGDGRAREAGADDQASPQPRPDAHTSPARCATCGRTRSFPSMPYGHFTAPHVQREATRAGESSADRRYTDKGGTNFAPLPGVRGGNPSGRWPANVVLDGEMAARLDEQSGVTTSGSRKAGAHGLMGYMGADAAPMPEVHGDSGGLSRMFRVFRYEPKATTAERPQVDGIAHPTVKPLNLMRWLVRLVTPPGGTVLEPFAGSGTTLEAALIEGFACIGIEREADYLPLILSRITKPLEQTLNFESEAS